MIGILNLEIGNIGSIANAIYEVGFDYEIIDTSGSWDHLTHLVLPGVGNFKTAMNFVNKHSLADPINAFSDSGRPIMGICLGMQLLMSRSHEGGINSGLNLIPGQVEKLVTSDSYPVPHVGWNSVSLEKEHPVLSGIKPDRDYYFVHSYHALCDDTTHEFGKTYYGDSITTIIAKKNIIGFQFHPEKSQVNGLKIIENFCHWNGKC